MSLKARLIAGMTLVAIVLVAVCTIITLTSRDHLVAQVDARLEASGPGGRRGFPMRPPGSEPVPAQRASEVYQGYIDASGSQVTVFVPNVGDTDYTAPKVDPTIQTGDAPRFFTTESVDGATTYRVMALRVGDVVFITAIPIDDVERTITRLVWLEIGGALAILAALGLVGWWVVHLGIRPVKEMTATAGRIAGGDLSVRVQEGAPGTESGALADSLNRMLATIERAIDDRTVSEERLRRFIADASHELRTPVTTIRGYAELYRHGALTERAALDDAMRRTEQESMRMGRLIDDMLALARLDERRPLAEAPVNVAAIVRDAVADARAAAPSRQISTNVTGDDTGDAGLTILGDDDLLRQVVANVVSNALVHTPDDVAVSADVHVDEQSVVVTIDDRGPGMEPDVAERVTERFFRADPARTRHRGGSGLGLSIVDSAVSAHGGTVEIVTASGEGTTVRLTFPLASTDASSDD